MIIQRCYWYSSIYACMLTVEDTSRPVLQVVYALIWNFRLRLCLQVNSSLEIHRLVCLGIQAKKWTFVTAGGCSFQQRTWVYINNTLPLIYDILTWPNIAHRRSAVTPTEHRPLSQSLLGQWNKEAVSFFKLFFSPPFWRATRKSSQ